MISRRTPEHILHIYGWKARLHVHRHLMFCAMYNKSTPCLSFATIERATAACKRNLDVTDMTLCRATQERTSYS